MLKERPLMAEELFIDPESTVYINAKTRRGEITMHNNSVAGKGFKIKTTKPNDYTVRPNIGIIHPLQKAQVEIFAQEHTTMSSEHKFLIEIYQFDWRKSMNEFKDFLKDAKQPPMIKKLLGIKIQDGGAYNRSTILTPRKLKDYLEISCLLFLLFQFVQLCSRLLF
eukprot:jgi/Antlo1/295/977